MDETKTVEVGGEEVRVNVVDGSAQAEVVEPAYDKQFAVLENVADDVFGRCFRDHEVIDTRGLGGDHNAAVVIPRDEPWNVSDDPISNLFTDFDVRYIRTGHNDTYDYEMDNVGLMIFVQLDE